MKLETPLTDLVKKAKKIDADDLKVMTDMLGRKPNATVKEFLLSTDAFYMVWLIAAKILKRRWKEAEHIIIDDPKYAYHYAKDVIKGRWKEAEEHIAEYPAWYGFYTKHFGINPDAKD